MEYNELCKPIPEREEPALCDKIEYINEPFIDVKKHGEILVDMQYPVLGMKNAEMDCYVRKSVYEMLLMAQENLPDGLKLKILDAWRPFLLQEELFYVYSKDIIKEFELEGCTKEQKELVISKFVCMPNKDQLVGPVHTTGGAVDVTLVDKDGAPLDMGSSFDEMTKRSYTVYYENEHSDEIRHNRRVLYNAMTEAGFTNLPSEWWHYDFGDRFHAAYTGGKIMYENVYIREQIHEEAGR